MNIKPFAPMLAATAERSDLVFPLAASMKLDGVRCLIKGGVALSRTLKPIPNRYVQAKLANMRLEGFDGELTVGPPNAPDVYRKTTSGVMAHAGEPDFQFHVFDRHDMGEHYGFETRFNRLIQEHHDLGTLRLYVSPLLQALVNNEAELVDFEEKALAMGYEGTMVRRMDAPYKFGRSTIREGYLMKRKLFSDSEAVVEGIEEEMFNGNEASTNELGRTKRSTAKAGLVGKGTMGALLVRDRYTGVEFKIGAGFTAADRNALWPLGTVVKYKFFPVGVKDKPRHPVFLGVRDLIDVGSPA